MALFKCKMCGGSLEIATGTTVIECEYCGTQQTLPKTTDENIQSLFNRANLLRQKNEFDKAEAVYEKILEADDTEAEAYWGVILCKFGIEYVEDPKTYKRIPTCHRTSYDSIVADEYYKKALEYADITQRSIYEEEAKKIDEIQKGILAISAHEEPYDVFICYKETDENGKRTQDSVIANDIYYQLNQEGFKVFYAAITLEGKLGSAYEPIIFAALNSAKVMLAIGTKPEYFNAVWVKNEWSRFLNIIKKDRSKLLIPCYRDMDAYELPEEFAHLQAQDMSKIGFINDVVRGIKKVIVKDEPKATVVKETVVKETVINNSNSAADPLIERAFLFLEDGQWESADEYAEKALDLDPKNARAYVVKLMVEFEIHTQEELEYTDFELDNDNYKKALRFADADLKETLTNFVLEERYGYALFHIEKAEEMEIDQAIAYYQKALEIFEDIEELEDILDRKYKDSDSLREQCNNKIAELTEKIAVQAEEARKDEILSSAQSLMEENKISSYEEAIRLFSIISGWKDADELVVECQKKIEELKVKAEADRIEAEIKAQLFKKKAIKIAKVVIPSLIVLIVLIVLTTTLFIPMLRFNQADKLFEEGKYAEAGAIYNELGGFSDNEQRVATVTAINLVQNKQFDNAITTLLSAGVPVELTYHTEGGSLAEVQTLAVDHTLSLDNSVIVLSEVETNSTVSEQNVFTFNKASDFAGLKIPGRNGYRFIEWVLEGFSYDVESEAATFALSLKASWSTKDYTIKYNLAGGTVNGTNIVEYDSEDEAFTLINPTRVGYTFVGWTGTDFSEPTINVTIPTGSYGNRTYTATWEANEYTITFDVNGGVLEETTQTIHYDETLALPSPTRDGYVFAGWYNGSKQYQNSTVWIETENVNLTAVWRIVSYDIAYKLDGGTNASGNPNTYQITSDAILKDPTKLGYTFDGWTYEGQSTPVKTPSLNGLFGNKTFTAHWTPISYTINLDPNGGSCTPLTLDVTFDKDFTLPTPEWEGHAFSGWYNGGTKVTSGTYKFPSDIKLVAKWDTINYTISYTMNGGTNPSSNPSYYTCNDKITLAEPTRTGYTFLGWTYSGQTTPTKNVTIAVGTIGDKTYTANWQANGYTVTLDANGGKVSSSTLEVTYDASFTLPTPTRTGYTFDGWYNGSTKYKSGIWTTANNITLTAKWTPKTDIGYVVNHYQQNANNDGYTLESTQNLKGTADATITPAVKSFTHFVSPSAQTVTIKPDGTLVVDYYYNRVTYDLTYVTNGGETIEKQTYKYDQTLVIATPTRTGYTFGGWFTDKTLGTAYSPSATLNENTTIYAYWEEENKPTDFTYSGTSAITVSAYKGTSTTMWIPAYIGGVPVTTIPSKAFYNETTLTKIVVPDTVTEIGKGAFEGCKAIEDITLPFVGKSANANYYDAVFGYIFGYTTATGGYRQVTISEQYENTQYGSISNSIWQYTCRNHKFQDIATYYKNKSYYYYIPTSIRKVTITAQTSIPTAAFNNCSFIETITLPTTVTSIGQYAFQNCNATVNRTYDKTLS